MTSSGLGRGHLLGYYEERTESLCIVKIGKFLDKLVLVFQNKLYSMELDVMAELLFRVYLVQII